jgi:hypothetical protein
MVQVGPMKHPSTQALFHYWNAQRGTRLAPERSDIDPRAIRHVLGDTIMLAADFVDQLRYRLAGTRVCALFCREIKGEAFSALWDQASCGAIDDLLAAVAKDKAGAVAGVNGRTNDGDQLQLELLLLPLAHHAHTRTRALGALATAAQPYWLGTKPLVELKLVTFRHLGQDVEPSFETPALQGPAGGRICHGFVVYSGGREGPPDTRTG